MAVYLNTTSLLPLDPGFTGSKVAKVINHPRFSVFPGAATFVSTFPLKKKRKKENDCKTQKK